MFTSMVTIHDLIRRIALITLAGYPDGVQAVKLRHLVELELKDYIDLKDKSNVNKFKNSLWDIDKRYPMYVEKQVITPKFVLLKPTGTLLEELNTIVIPDLDKYFQNHNYEFIEFDFDEDDSLNEGNNQNVSQRITQDLKTVFKELLENDSLRSLVNISSDDKKVLPLEIVELLAQLEFSYENFTNLKRKVDKL